MSMSLKSFFTQSDADSIIAGTLPEDFLAHGLLQEKQRKQEIQKAYDYIAKDLFEAEEEESKAS